MRHGVGMGLGGREVDFAVTLFSGLDRAMYPIMGVGTVVCVVRCLREREIETYSYTKDEEGSR